MGRAGVGVSLTTLKTRVIRDRSELVTHFDQSAADYHEAHGDADRLLAYRLGLIRRNYEARKDGILLEIGCGTGIHLANLAGDFARVIGTDISPKMIRAAREKLHEWPSCERIELRVDPAEELSTVEDTSVDVALCVGALEHMLEKAKVLRQVERVLKQGGLFVCLTPNGDYWWYTVLAPCLGIRYPPLIDGPVSSAPRGDDTVRKRGSHSPQLRVLDFRSEGRYATVGQPNLERFGLAGPDRADRLATGRPFGLRDETRLRKSSNA